MIHVTMICYSLQVSRRGKCQLVYSTCLTSNCDVSAFNTSERQVLVSEALRTDGRRFCGQDYQIADTHQSDLKSFLTGDSRYGFHSFNKLHILSLSTLPVFCSLLRACLAARFICQGFLFWYSS